MVNAARGEVAIEIDGTVLPMRLTLGALAELETRLSAGSLLALAERFECAEVRSDDLLALLAAGLRGAGHEIDERRLATASIGGGAIGALQAGLALMGQTFQPRGPDE